jgi:uncharacterized membrane protein HdeD (DUF308 family)
MLELLSRHWWAVLLRGVAAVLFGLMALIWPGITLAVLVLLWGAYVLVDGAFALGTAIFGGASAEGRRFWLVLEGAAGIAAGVITFIWPGITAFVLLALIAVWALLTGVLEIVVAIRLRREIRGEWLLGLSGVLSVVFGIALLVRPREGAIAVTWLIGIYALMFGAVLVALSLALRRRRNQGSKAGAERTVPV